MALIRMCVVPNCSQRLSRPVLWIVAVCATYWTHTTAVCLLMIALTRLWLPTHPHHPQPLFHLPTPYTCHLGYYICCEKVAQNPAVLAS